MSESNAFSMTCSISSRETRRLTIESPSGITIRTELRPTEFGSLADVSPGFFFNSPSSSRWPGHPPTTEDMRMRVVHRLPGVAAGVEDHPVAGVGHALGSCHLVSLAKHLGQQPIAGGGQRGQVAIVIPRNHPHVHRRLRIDITKCDRARGFEHSGGRYFAGRPGRSEEHT